MHAPSQRQPLLVRSVPAGHPYVRHVAGDGVQLLPDPPVAGAPEGQWWPHPALEAAWVRDADAFDVYHLHFGYDARTPAQLTDLVAELVRRRVPLVLTVHDLRNPHHASPGDHEAALDVLVPAAAAVITLTDGAAREIAARWGRDAVVLPHPHLVPLTRMRPAPGHQGFVVGVPLGSLRANSDPLAVLPVLVQTLAELPDGELRISLQPEVLRPEHPRHDARLTALLEDLRGRPGILVTARPAVPDEQLWDELEQLDALVLPYRFGTHSGWVEACWDLGTTVVAPDCGHLHQQRPCVSYRHTEDGLDATSLRAAVLEVWRSRPQWQADPEDRRSERELLAASHRELYREALAA